MRSRNATGCGGFRRCKRGITASPRADSVAGWQAASWSFHDASRVASGVCELPAQFDTKPGDVGTRRRTRASSRRSPRDVHPAPRRRQGWSAKVRPRCSASQMRARRRCGAFAVNDDVTDARRTADGTTPDHRPPSAAPRLDLHAITAAAIRAGRGTTSHALTGDVRCDPGPWVPPRAEPRQHRVLRRLERRVLALRVDQPTRCASRSRPRTSAGSAGECASCACSARWRDRDRGGDRRPLDGSPREGPAVVPGDDRASTRPRRGDARVDCGSSRPPQP